MKQNRTPRREAPGRPQKARAASAPGRAPVARNWPWWLPPALATLAAGLLHVRALRSQFFADDWLFLDTVRSRSLVGALLARDPIGNFFRPLGRAAWFWTLAQASGESALVFHVANQLLWLASIALLWALARRLAGSRAAAIAAVLFAFTQAADVPVRWASGSQDLLAVALALAAMLLFVRGRRAWAAVLFMLAPLAKEVVALAVVPAALLAREPGESWRRTLSRAWPAFAGTAAWAVVMALAMSQRHGASPLSFSLLAPLGAVVDALRTLLGIEWSTGDTPPASILVLPTLAALVIGLLAVATSRLERARARVADGEAVAPAGRDVMLGAGAWLLLGALPVAFVAPIWSAYFYLFALAGAALLAGTLLARAPLSLALALVLLVGVADRRAGNLREFATTPGAFTAQSHVNDFYLGRGMDVIARGVEDLRRERPYPPHNSTFFFTGVPSFAAFQTADGPLVRSVYRDSSLRSYYLTDLSAERMRRGPAWFVFYKLDDGRFHDESSDPTLFLRVALGQILNGHEDGAREALEIGRARGHQSPTVDYLAAFMAIEAGDRAAANAHFAAAGCVADSHGDAELAQANARAAAGDTTGAINVLSAAVSRHALDARLHSRIVDLQMSMWASRSNAGFEAYVARVLAPSDGLAWKRWAYALYWQSRFVQAQAALEKYFALSPELASQDADALQMRRDLPRLMPGGDIMQRALLREATR